MAGVERTATAAGTKPIFISYRRGDTSGYAGRLQDDLGELFGDALVFRDVVRIEPGKDWLEVIDGALKSSVAMLVVIGREWLDVRDETGRRRLDDPTDVLRIEVAAALQRDTLVIPVLVEKAPMPGADELPESLRGLARRQALELTDTNWDHDITRLATAIATATGMATRPAAGAARARLVPTRALVAVGGVLALLMVTLAVRVVTNDDRPAPMTGRLNIAVAEFAELDARGNVVKSPAATQLSRTFDRLVDQEVRSIEGGQEVQHRLIGRLDQPDPARRAAAAERAGRDIAADIVVYGVLQTDTSGSTLTPEFYITDRLLFDAPEVVGPHQLGSQIRSAGGDAGRLAVQQQLLDQLRVRIEVLAEITVALRYYSVEDYRAAFDHLVAAEARPGWAPEDGREILYLLLGNASGRLGRLADAEAWYDRALSVRPDDSRASLGKAEVLYHFARDDCEAGHVDAGALRRSLAAYAGAGAGRLPAGADVPTKVAFGEGRVLLCLSQALVTDSWSDATARFDVVIKAYEAGNEALRELAAEAHANLGLIRRPWGSDEPGARKKYVDAAGEYTEAINIYQEAGIHRERQAFFYAELGYLQAQAQDRTKAASAFATAIRLAPDATTAEKYRQSQRDVTPGRTS